MITGGGWERQEWFKEQQANGRRNRKRRKAKGQHMPDDHKGMTHHSQPRSTGQVHDHSTSVLCKDRNPNGLSVWLWSHRQRRIRDSSVWELAVWKTVIWCYLLLTGRQGDSVKYQNHSPVLSQMDPLWVIGEWCSWRQEQQKLKIKSKHLHVQKTDRDPNKLNEAVPWSFNWDFTLAVS